MSWPIRAASVMIWLLIVQLATGCSQSPASDLSQAMDAYFEATEAALLADAIDEVIATGASVDEIAARLRAGRTYFADTPTGWSVETCDAADGEPRPYHIYVPSGYDPSVRHTVLFDLHGAVSRSPEPAEAMMVRRRLWEDVAEANRWILVVPHGDQRSTWFSASGLACRRAELASLKRVYNIDEDKVFVSGISDGGSGAFWLGLRDPTPWAGMISFNGHPGIAAGGPYQAYPRNLSNRPIRATSGETDTLYPPSGVAPFIDLFTELGADIEWAIYPGGHRVEFLDEESAAFVEFVSDTERNPAGSSVVWETSDTTVGRCDWVSIDEIADVGNNAVFQDMNLAEAPDPEPFGVSLAYQGGTRFTVAGVQPESIALGVGIRNGDQIVAVGDMAVSSQRDIDQVILRIPPGRPLTVDIIREGISITLEGFMPSGELIYPRALPTGSIRAEADGNTIRIDVSHVSRFSLLIGSRQFDLSAPITVITNGETVFSSVVQADARFMLEQAAVDLDRETVYESRIRIDVPEGAS